MINNISSALWDYADEIYKGGIESLRGSRLCLMKSAIEFSDVLYAYHYFESRPKIENKENSDKRDHG